MDLVVIQGVGDLKVMQVRVHPSHGVLDSNVEVPKRIRGRRLDCSPNRRLDVLEGNSELVNFVVFWRHGSTLSDWGGYFVIGERPPKHRHISLRANLTCTWKTCVYYMRLKLLSEGKSLASCNNDFRSLSVNAVIHSLENSVF